MPIDMRIDVSRCIGCRACEVACVTANDLPPTSSRNSVPHLETTDSSHATFAPSLCHHCERPPCVPACPTGASYQAEDGRVLVDQDLCIGCGLCVPACPYDARFVEPTLGTLEKCTLCHSRVAAGQTPACFDVCPAHARHYVETTGAGDQVSVGDLDALDRGHTVTRRSPEGMDIGPRLSMSGRPEDLSLLDRLRPLTVQAAAASTLWRGGVGLAVQGLGAAALAAMGAMVGLRALRSRREAVARGQEASSQTESEATDG